MAPQLISFARGAPSVDIVDIAGLKAAAQRAFDADPGGLSGYGTSVGYLPLREWIADRHGVGAERVLVTNGSMQADAFLFDALVRPGSGVVVEEPTYDRTLRSLTERGADVWPVPLRDDGVDTGALAALLGSGARPVLAHIIPNFQNPAGVALSLAKRRELLKLAGEYQFTIFEDDPYHDIRFRGEAQPTMLSLDASVVYASSFSKTVCPGVRVGYLVGPAELIAGIVRRATATYISPSMVAQGIVYQFAVSGDIDRSIKHVRAALAERATRLAQALAEHLPEARFTAPDGGYFLWVELPDAVNVDLLAPAAAARGVAVVKGSDFLLRGGEHALRLAYSAVTVDQIDEGVRRLAAAVQAVRGE